MKNSLFCCAGLAAIVAVGGARPKNEPTLNELAELAVSADESAADDAIARLREAGPDGLEALLATHRETIEQHAVRTKFGLVQPDLWPRLSRALNAVGAQYDCHASRLYWHTDLDAALAAAAEEGKPVLSLRMLGRLDEECSCANSRFFRTALYANREVSQVLRERFVLHWKSVRPVPKVTIDFGDGRVLHRTLTGNSIHYVLDSRGRTIDALPGLYGPGAFREHLLRVEGLHHFVRALDDEPFRAWRKGYHRGHVGEIVERWRRDLARVDIDIEGPRAPVPANDQPGQQEAPAAGKATRLTVSKMAVELPVLVRMQLARKLQQAQENTLAELEKATTDEVWKRIAALHAEESELDSGSVALMREHMPARAAGALAVSKALVEDPLLRVVASFQRSIALDTVRNEYDIRRRISEWFAAGEAPAALEDLNERVYAQLFLTPRSDPWLGLMPDDVYTALVNNGQASGDPR